MRFFNVLNQVINPVVIKPHTVDQTFCIDQTEQTRFIVTRLRAWRHGTNLNGTKSHRAERINALPVFIQSGSKPERIFKRQPHTGNRFCRYFLAHKRFKRCAGNAT
ncbi:hypothetical protein SDC9_178887 [bioreactor metagenome]|uniref:Uncharacterized protein n=1 Tax=bioreactor metagenome TaxID=1076179 RepID=A0A645H6G3_9ZZZZ